MLSKFLQSQMLYRRKGRLLRGLNNAGAYASVEAAHNPKTTMATCIRGDHVISHNRGRHQSGVTANMRSRAPAAPGRRRPACYTQNSAALCSPQRAGVAKLADARDSKSRGVHPPCGFDSLLRHQPSFPSGLPLSSGSYLSRRSCGRTVAIRTAAKADGRASPCHSLVVCERGCLCASCAQSPLWGAVS